MVNKKKYVNIFYIVLLGALFAIFFGLFSNSYAMTDEEFDFYLDYMKENYPTNHVTTGYVTQWFNTYSNSNIISKIKEKIDISNYNLLTIQVEKPNASTYIYLRFHNKDDNNKAVLVNNYIRLRNLDNSGSNGPGVFTTTDSTTYSSLSSDNILFYNLSSSDFINFCFPTIDFFENVSSDIPKTFYELTGKNLITTTYSVNDISLVSQSNYKFGFNNKNQLNVYLNGYSIYDFKFYVQRYIDGEWGNFTDGNDYYILINNDTGTIFENPYFVNWININYFPVGTYRYMAEYTGDNAFSVVSEDFNITNGSISDSGTAIGTIDENGNIDININVDNGNSVNDIKDFIGGPADFNNTTISQDDIDKAVNLNFIDNPYENFILNFFNGLVSSLSADASDITFRVHTWGELRTVSVADFTPNYNNDIRVFLTIISTIVWCFVIVKWCTKIIDGLTHMSIQDCVDLVDAHYSNLF